MVRRRILVRFGWMKTVCYLMRDVRCSAQGRFQKCLFNSLYTCQASLNERCSLMIVYKVSLALAVRRVRNGLRLDG